VPGTRKDFLCWKTAYLQHRGKRRRSSASKGGGEGGALTATLPGPKKREEKQKAEPDLLAEALPSCKRRSYSTLEIFWVFTRKGRFSIYVVWEEGIYSDPRGGGRKILTLSFHERGWTFSSS